MRYRFSQSEGPSGITTQQFFQRLASHLNAHEDDDAEAEGVYIISVAARILEMHPQTLRKYERVGLISPFRTVGVRRLYSDEDIARLRLIKHLVGDLGLNLAGVQLVLDVFNELLALRSKTIELEGTDLNAHLRKSLDTLFTLLYTGQTEPDDDTD